MNRTGRAQQRVLPTHAETNPLGGVYLSKQVHKPRVERWPRPRVYGQYALVYVFQGRGSYEQPQMRAPVDAGDLIMVFPDVPHTYSPDPNGWTEHHIVFDGPVFRLWDRVGLIDRQRPVLRLDPVDAWLDRFRSVIGGEPVEEVLRLQDLLMQVHLRHRPRRDDWKQRVQAMIADSLDHQPTVADLADRLSVSPSTFYRQFTQTFGMSPSRYMAARVIDRACRLIHEEDLTNDELARRLGFADAFHFSRRFKQVTGQSPSQFRHTLDRR